MRTCVVMPSILRMDDFLIEIEGQKENTGTVYVFKFNGQKERNDTSF